MTCDTRQQSGRPGVVARAFPPLRHAGPHDPDNGDDDVPEGQEPPHEAPEPAEEEPPQIEEETEETERRFPPWRHIPGFQEPGFEEEI